MPDEIDNSLVNPLNGKPKRDRLSYNDPVLENKRKWAVTGRMHKGYLKAKEEGKTEIDTEYLP